MAELSTHTNSTDSSALITDEKKIFSLLQQNFAANYSYVFNDRKIQKTIVVIPSLTLDQEILSKIKGHIHYEERLLCLLMLLRMPRTHVIFITSMPVDPVIIDYYLHLLPGITRHHALQRLTMLSCYDASSRSLTEKILERPRLLQRIKKSLQPGHAAHLACFTVTSMERSLAVQLNMPIYGCDPELESLGNKSNSRKIFRSCGLRIPDGFEDLQNENDIVDALTALKEHNPSLRKAVIKMNNGFSGEGNAVFSFDGFEEQTHIRDWVSGQLPIELSMVDKDLTYKSYINKFEIMGGIVEEFIDGNIIASPSVQCRINPLGECKVVSTHDQWMGGSSGQVFMGADFPASQDYAVEIGQAGLLLAGVLRQQGVLGRFGIDFLSVKDNSGWNHYALEINLRKGGTTHPYLLLQFLTDGDYNHETGMYTTASGQTRYYFCSDNLENKNYRGLTPPDLIDIATYHELQYDGSSQEGVMFHLIGALSQYGKLGVVCIGSTPERARKFYEQTVNVLDLECQNKNDFGC